MRKKYAHLSPKIFLKAIQGIEKWIPQTREV
jgi:hypothetical protein